MTESKTTAKGYINRNKQKNLGFTYDKGSDHGQYFYILECQQCGKQYKSNNFDIF